MSKSSGMPATAPGPTGEAAESREIQIGVWTEPAYHGEHVIDAEMKAGIFGSRFRFDRFLQQNEFDEITWSDLRLRPGDIPMAIFRRQLHSSRSTMTTDPVEWFEDRLVGVYSCPWGTTIDAMIRKYNIPETEDSALRLWCILQIKS